MLAGLYQSDKKTRFKNIDIVTPNQNFTNQMV